MDRIAELVQNLDKKVIAWRRDFHKYPETAWTEYRTSAAIAEHLQALGYEVFLGRDVLEESARVAVPSEEALEAARQRALGEGANPEYLEKMRCGFTGVMGVLHCGEGPTLAFRADIDALEVKEDVSEQHRPAAEGFASVHDGICHSCGHDAHAAMGMGLAEVLAGMKDQLHGTIKLLFQPGEEGMRGGKPMMEKGLVDDVDFILGGHIGIHALKTGEIVTGCDEFLSTSKLDAEFFGESAHAGICPQKGKSAIMAAATACIQMQAIPRHGDGHSRINVGFIQGGGGSRNVVPNYCIVKLETRGATTEINSYMEQQVRIIADASAKLHGATARITNMGSAVGSDSDPEMMAVVKRAAQKTAAVTVITDKSSFDACEDVTYLMNRVRERGGKATFLMIGSELKASHHSGSFDFNEDCLNIGVEVFARCVAELLK